jgi:lipoyl(octanoyl) transferase
MEPVFRHLGLRPYEPVWRDMQAFTDAREAGTPDEIWLLEHEPVFTLGKNAQPQHVLDAGGIPVVQIDRGGQVTYHGPGQLVVYVLLDIVRLKTGVRSLVSALEDSVVELLAGYGVQAASRRDAPGVYVDDSKIAALGLRIRQGCSFHGLALNVDMDLEPFSRINPCGYEGLAVTQLSTLARDVTMAQVEQRLSAILLQKLYS